MGAQIKPIWNIDSIKAVVRPMVPESLWLLLHNVVYGCFRKMRAWKMWIWWRISQTQCIERCQYQDLIEAEKILDEGAYRELSSDLFSMNVNRIGNKEKIKVWFVLFLDSVWSCDQLYRLFEASQRFEPAVVLMNFINDEIHERNKCLVREHNYKYLTSDDIIKNKYEPDIVMYPTLYPQNVERLNIGDRKLGTLIFCIPYTFWWDQATDASMYKSENASVIWRFYAPTKIHMQMGVQRNIIGSQIMRYSGYPKLDMFFDCNGIGRKKGQKTIIYAPGMCSNKELVNFSTFEFNARDILRLAKSTENMIDWIFRPHPLLGISLDEYGVMVFKDYQAYEAEWSKVANAQISIGGPYQDIFLNSDAMITDAISFVASYQYVKKPLLFIDRHRGEGLNEFGQKLHEVVYHAEAKEIEKIKWFIEEVVIGGNDILKEKREAFFREYLDYYSENHFTASEYIYNDICKAFLGGE